MATTEQRSGFRLPWATDTQSDAGLDQGTVESTVSPESSGDPQVAAEPSPIDEVTVSDTAVATTSAPSSVERAPSTTSDGWSSEDAWDGPASTGEPVEDSPPQPQPQAAARPSNSLITGLVRAMREAAESTRKEALEAVAVEAQARTEQIKAESAQESAEIRRTGDHDVAEIREWSKARMAKLREETDEKITDRRRRLELECEDEAARMEHRINLVQQSMTDYEARMEAFFATLMAEDDPARLAGFAEQMPQLPDLTTAADLAGWTPSHALDAEDAAAAESAAAESAAAESVAAESAAAESVAAESVAAESVAAESVVVDDSPADAGETEASAAPEETDDMVAFDVTRFRSALVEPEATFESGTAEPEVTGQIEVAVESEPIVETDPVVATEAAVEPQEAADAPLEDGAQGSSEPSVTRLSVVGLISVASIAGFKRAVAKTAGIDGISVASGPSGEFIFTVRHDASVDLREIVTGISGFAASVTGEEDGVLSVTASQPADLG